MSEISRSRSQQARSSYQSERTRDPEQVKSLREAEEPTRSPFAEYLLGQARQSQADKEAERQAMVELLTGRQAAAEDERIFLLQRMLPPEVWRRASLTETRPPRSYPILWPGSSRPRQIRPEFHGVGVVQAATHAHGGIHTRGLGLMFPPHTLHARNSTSVVVGDNCELQQVDHVHIRQAVVAQDDALKSVRVKRIIARARPDRDNADVVRDLRIALNDLVERPEEAGPTTMTRKLRADCVPSIHQAESVQLGDDALTRLDSRYVVERTVIPAGALLADSEELARRYVDLVAAPQEDPDALADFLADLVGAAENATDENVLGYADGLPQQRATVLGLFGLLTVDHATSIMIGTGNHLHTELDLETARFRPDPAIKGAVARHRKNRPDEPAPAPRPQPRRRPSPADAPTPTRPAPGARPTRSRAHDDPDAPGAPPARRKPHGDPDAAGAPPHRDWIRDDPDAGGAGWWWYR